METPRRTIETVNGSIVESYKLSNHLLHREDGPAFSRTFPNGGIHEEWWYEGQMHRFGGPAMPYSNGMQPYFIYGQNVSDVVHEWLSSRGYVWATMTDIEKWELELFMRSLDGNQTA